MLAHYKLNFPTTTNLTYARLQGNTEQPTRLDEWYNRQHGIFLEWLDCFFFGGFPAQNEEIPLQRKVVYFPRQWETLLIPVARETVVITTNYSSQYNTIKLLYNTNLYNIKKYK